MNSIITLPKLVDLLAARAGVDKATANEFIAALTSMASDILAEGETLKLKGIGTFKPVPGKKGVEFVPDAVLAEAVNAPFSVFSTVDLNEGVTEEVLDEAAGKVVETTTAYSETVTADKPEEPEEETPEKETPEIPSETPVEETQKVPTEEEPTEEESEEEEPHEEDSEDDEPQKEESQEEENQEKESEEEESEEEETEEEESEEEETEEEESSRYPAYSEEGKSSGKGLWIVTALIIGLLLGFTAGFLLHDKVQQWIAGAPVPPSPLEETVEETSTTETVDEDEPNTDGESSVAGDAENTRETEAGESDPAETDSASETKAETAETPEPIYVTTGEKGVYLATWAKKYYGNEAYWIYIYKENNPPLTNPNNIAPGLKLTIPPFEKYKTSDDPAKNLQDAKNEGSALQRKYSN